MPAAVNEPFFPLQDAVKYTKKIISLDRKDSWDLVRNVLEPSSRDSSTVNDWWIENNPMQEFRLDQIA